MPLIYTLKYEKEKLCISNGFCIKEKKREVYLRGCKRGSEGRDWGKEFKWKAKEDTGRLSSINNLTETQSLEFYKTTLPARETNVTCSDTVLSRLILIVYVKMRRV